jgi:P27 family predicted phage terminase small subunit
MEEMMEINISHLDKAGKELYAHIIETLKDKDRYQLGDEVVVEQLCSYHQDYRWAIKEIKKRGIGRIMVYPNGTKNVAAEWTIKKNSAEMVQKLSRELGLSPNSRKELGNGAVVEKPKEKVKPKSPLELKLENKRKA